MKWDAEKKTTAPTPLKNETELFFGGVSVFEDKGEDALRQYAERLGLSDHDVDTIINNKNRSANSLIGGIGNNG